MTAEAIPSLFLNDTNMVLATDLYQLTMMASYLEWEMEEPASFELFVRRLPKGRSFLVAAGLEQCVHYLKNLHFSGEDIDYLRELDVFSNVSERFFERLRAWRFSGDVDAIGEGNIFFGHEPLMRIRAPLFEAQLVETYLLSTINYQTSVASKAARITLAAQGRRCFDFGTRRAHGPQAGLYAARASYLAGLHATSNVLAGKLCRIPVVGTAAHAFTMACPSEEEAFRRYHHSFPKHTTLLIDTYDTLRGAQRASEIEGELKGVRLDSGDLVELSKQVREILDRNGRQDAKIAASGDLNEYKLAEMIQAGARIDLFGVGTELVTSKDHPALGGVYKLVSKTVDGLEQPTMKLSEGKMTYPSAKQVWRVFDQEGRLEHDVLELASAPAPTPAARALLAPVLRKGQLVSALPSLDSIRAHCLSELERLPSSLCQLGQQAQYRVEIGPELAALVEKLRSELG
ncbi:MAG: nicotinate phosphoribosyltransferase [Myxococcota bacterium]|nr:nicotinate phosphoribosyltransferase [Myxococcota bacterium]